MKLLPSFMLGSCFATQRMEELGPLKSIAFAHARVRNGFTIPEMDVIIEQNERLMQEVMAPGFNGRHVSLEEMISKSNNITGQFRSQGKCDSSFPTYDGSCNHPEDKGRSLTNYERLVAAEYCDNKSAPRCSTRKKELPSERTLSTTMRRAGGAPKPNKDVSYLVTAWGQFITHDIIQTPDVGNGQVPCSCKEHKSCKNIKINKNQESTLSFPCMFVIRSSSKLGMGVNGQPQREQLNQLTPMIDGTTVYGFNVKHRNLLTDKDGMHLKMSDNKFGDFLPNVRQMNNKGITDKFETADVFNDKDHSEFVAGDTRVLENPTLSSFHTMFARLHNVAVDELVKLNPNWSADRVFEEARLIVMSVIKQVNYAEHLPVLLGPQAIQLVDGVKVSRAHRRERTRFARECGPACGGRANGKHMPPREDNPQIRQEFLVAAYRYGHAMVPEDLTAANDRLAINNRLPLKDNYFDPDLVHKAGPGGCLRGAMAQTPNMVSGSYADSTQNNLFKPNNFRHGVDLLSINFARGRDHGVANYHAVRDFCMNHPTFGKLYAGKVPEMLQGWNAVTQLYDSPKDIDLYAGVLMEQHMPGGQVGPTAGCIIAEQFTAIRKGDRFWHENKGVFKDDQLAEIKRTGLAKILCTTMENMNKVHQNPFLAGEVVFNGNKNGVQTCDKIGKIDFSAWKQRAASAAPAPTPAAGAPSDAEPGKQPNVDVDHSVVAGKINGPRKKGVFLFGGPKSPWTNEELKSLIEAVKESNALPIRGKTAVIKGFPIKGVRRLAFGHNPDLTDDQLLGDLVALFPNLNELDISSTNFGQLSLAMFGKNKNLFHIKALNSPASCFDEQLAMMLESNMKKNMKRFIWL